MRDQIRGKMEELEGKVTGNRGREFKGRMSQAVGNARRARDIREDVRQEATRRRERETDQERAGRPRATSG
jgi:uncharacterized protein YjbJ (UPF0337 family)